MALNAPLDLSVPTYIELSFGKIKNDRDTDALHPFPLIPPCSFRYCQFSSLR